MYACCDVLIEGEVEKYYLMDNSGNISSGNSGNPGNRDNTSDDSNPGNSCDRNDNARGSSPGNSGNIVGSTDFYNVKGDDSLTFLATGSWKFKDSLLDSFFKAAIYLKDEEKENKKVMNC